MSKPNERKTSQLQVPPRLWTWIDSVVAQAGFLEFDANDAAAHAKTKVVEFLREVEAGKRRMPRNLEAYVKEVGRNALADWIRDRKARGARIPSAAERSLLDNEMYSSLAEEGDAERGGFHALLAPSLSRPQRKGRPFLLSLLHIVHPPYWEWPESPKAQTVRRAAQMVGRDPVEYLLQADARIRSLPLRAGQAAHLYLSGVEQAGVARRLRVSRTAASKLLDRARKKWGWDLQRLHTERLRLLFANLIVVVRAADRPFQPEPVDTSITPHEPEPVDTSITPHEPEPNDAPITPRWSGFDEIDDLTKGPDRPLPDPDPLAAALELAHEDAVLRAITSSPALRAWAHGLEHHHMREVVECVYELTDMQG